MTDSQDLENLKRSPSALRVYFSRAKFTRAGKEYKARCCFHTEDTPSLTLFQAKGIWLYKCHGCQVSGNCIQFVQKMDGISFSEAVKKVREVLGEPESNARVDEVFKPIVGESKDYETYSLDEYSIRERAFENSPEALAYLKSRGISYETAKKCHTGFRQNLPTGDEASHLSALGWVVFPRIKDDRIIGIHYRSIKEKVHRRHSDMQTQLMGLDFIDPLEPIYLVEGEEDLLTFVEAGLRAVSLPGATGNLTPEQKDLLLQAEYVVLAGDTDAVGEAAMAKLGTVLGERCCLLRWPEQKDANAYFLLTCGGDISVFRAKVEELTALAKSQPMPGLYDLKSTILSSGRSSLADHPLRLRMPWADVDRMAILLPGSVTTISSTNSGCGKTQWVHQVALYNAMHHNEVVVNWQVELSADEIAGITIAHLTWKDRNHLTPADAKEAVRKLGNARYYVGYDPTLTTVESVLNLLEAAVKKTSCSLLILDHIHHLLGTADNEVQALSNAMQRLKRLAQTYMLKIIVVAQPRKATSASKGKSLHMTDLKGSEALSSTADAVFALHRNYTKANSDPNNFAKDEYDPLTEVRLLKVRAKGDGAAEAKLFFMGMFSSFLNLNEVQPSGSPEASAMF